MSKKDSGIKGEEMAVKFLKKNGYKIITRNFRSYDGEIDIIALKEKYLSFVEVKLRNNQEFGDIKYSIDKKKRERIIKTALYFITENKKYSKFDIRFDAVFLERNDNEDYKISLMKNIFFIDNNIKGFY